MRPESFRETLLLVFLCKARPKNVFETPLNSAGMVLWRAETQTPNAPPSASPPEIKGATEHGHAPPQAQSPAG
jgi:hypothetical protein